MGHSDLDPAIHERRPWNAGKSVGPKRPLKPRDIWAIRFYLDEHKRLRDRALFDLAIDSKLRGCDLVKLRIGDLVSAGSLRNRATVIQQIARSLVDHRCLRPAQRMGAVFADVESNGRDPFINQPGVLARAQVTQVVNAAWENEVINRSASALDPGKQA